MAEKFQLLPNSGREDWLEQRKHVITATDIARIAQGPGEARKVRAEKNGAPGFQGNRYTEWGLEREPEIQRYVTRRLAPGAEPNDLLAISLVDERFAATPDMLIYGDDDEFSGRIVEIKTTKTGWAPGGHPQRYEDQIQWQLLVTGADECLLVWETYTDLGEMGFTPSFSPASYAVKPDPRRQRELKELAESFLDGVEYGLEDDADRENVETLLDRFIEARDKATEWKTRQKELGDELKAALGGEPTSVQVGGYTLTVTKPSSRTSFDVKRFKAENAQLAAEYTAEKTIEPSLRVTEIKNKEG